MKNIQKFDFKQNWSLLVVIIMLISVFIYQCIVAFTSVPFIVTRATFDDTFLYLEVARNWANNGFPSFDGETLTNGIQPLWGGFLYILALFVKDNILFLRISLIICAILNVLTAYPIIKIGEELGKKEIGYLAAASWALYSFIPKSILGMEAPLNGLVFALMVWMSFYLWTKPNKMIELKEVLLFSIILTLNGFCRLDAGIISAFIYILFFSKLIKSKEYKFIFLMTIIPAVSLSIYLLANKLIFGAMTPISGKAKMFWAHKAIQVPLSEKIMNAIVSFWNHGLYSLSVVSGERLGFPFTRLIILSILITASLIYGIVKLKLKKLWLFVALFIIMVLHTTIIGFILQQFNYAFWYYQPLRILMCLGIGCIAILLTIPHNWMRYIRYGLISLGLLLFIYTGRKSFADLKYAKPSSHFYMRRVEAAQWLDKTNEIENGYKIGAWNAGQLGFFTKNKTVVNLDGLVQSTEFLEEVLYTGDWKTYFRENDIRYLVDYNEVDAAQTYKLEWDRNVLFRNIVPLSKAKVIKNFGVIQVLDIQPWLDDDSAK